MSTSQKYTPRSKKNNKNAVKNQQMDIMPSVSRSSGLEKGGDALKNAKTQEEYWSFVQSKIFDYWKQYPEGSPDSKVREEARHSVLILIRKLREGIMAAKREDQFASDVYETSLRISILFSSSVNIASTLSYLLPTYYTSRSLTHSRDSTILITLLLQLDSSYPSQREYYEHCQEFLASGCIARDSPTIPWLASLARAIRSCNYYRVEALTRPKVYTQLLESLPQRSSKGAVDLDSSSVHSIISSLHDRLRDRSWPILRVAYREMTFLPKITDTSEWLRRSLIFDSSEISVDTWFRQQSEKGNVKAKEEIEGKWMIIKPTPN
ncbi:hypothetical protein BDM02DRAFT_858045 [Thelephora ganbajun]|uniref:Uncharacterized protein n=1 Tax=Thelephora ganbajun TaxID=370292 RepID=A0ACB6ZPK5_THEGA|nr:hypothetical protein BDM02DRAFT_858045 [Thelephora ganbajun]